MRARAAQALVVVAAVAALGAAFAGGLTTGRKADDWQTWYRELPETARDDPVSALLGFDDRTWDELGRILGRGDRYAVVATGADRFEVQNYAAYRLLPAIQTLPEVADVFLHYRPDTRPPGCLPAGEDACVVRREAR